MKTRSIDLPSDSGFAVAMRTQQEAERAEQQRIKNLVLNYDLTDDQNDGEEPSFHYMHVPGSNRVALVGKGSLNKSLKSPYQTGQSQHETAEDEVKEEKDTVGSPTLLERPVNVPNSLTDETGTFDTLHGQPRLDKSGNTRNKQRARKLDLKTIEWYDKRPTSTPAVPPPPEQASLDAYVVDKSKRGNARHDSVRGGGGRRNKAPG